MLSPRSPRVGCLSISSHFLACDSTGPRRTSSSACLRSDSPSGAGSALGAWRGAGFLGRGLACSLTQQLGATAAGRDRWPGDAERGICREGHHRGQVRAESARACVQGTGLCRVLSAPVFPPFSRTPPPGGTGCALHPPGLPCSESKTDD